MKRLFVAAALLGALLTSVPVSASSGLVAVGLINGPCGEGIVTIQGVATNTADTTWIFVAQVLFTEIGCPGSSAPVLGNWTPSEGGCVSSWGMRVCLYGPIPQGATQGVSVSVTAPIVGTHSGSATVVRA